MTAADDTLTREEFASLLAAQVARGEIPEGRAAALLARFDPRPTVVHHAWDWQVVGDCRAALTFDGNAANSAEKWDRVTCPACLEIRVAELQSQIDALRVQAVTP